MFCFCADTVDGDIAIGINKERQLEGDTEALCHVAQGGAERGLPDMGMGYCGDFAVEEGLVILAQHLNGLDKLFVHKGSLRGLGGVPRGVF